MSIELNWIELSVLAILIGNDEITPSSSVQNLGVIFNDTLSLWPHIASVVKAVFFQCHHISCIQNFLTLSATKTFVHSLIAFHLDYCSSTLTGLPNINIQKLQCVQNTAACLSVPHKKFDLITPVLKGLHWLPIQQWIPFKVLALTYKALHDQAPPYIQSLLTVHSPKWALRSSNSFSLKMPWYNTQFYGAWAFSQLAPIKYNKLPQDIIYISI